MVPPDSVPPDSAPPDRGPTNGASLGGVSPESPFFNVPQPIIDLANSLVDFVERALGIRPDFSMETLSIVDHYAVQARGEVLHRPEVLDLTAQALGAYFGEVVRRNLGAFWLIPSPNFHDWSLCGTTAFISINPIGVGYDALLGSNDHNGPSSQLKLSGQDRALLQDRLGNLPEVGQDEYHSLCTRLEVLEIAMDCIRGQATARGYDEVTYSAEDYGGGPMRLEDL